MARKQSSSQRLRKQPRMRRVQSAHVVPVPRLDVPKTARKRRRRNKRRVRLPLTAVKQFIFSARWISLGLLSLTIYALVLTGLDERFYLTMIPVEGVASIPPSEIVEASQLAGAHVFGVDPNEAAARIAQLPGVINAAVTLTWPNHVLIEVQEDSPVAVWQEREQQYWVTGNGRLIPARAAVPGLVLIESEMPVTAVPEAETPDSVAEAETAVPQPSLAFIPEDVLAGAQQLRQLRPDVERLYYRPSTGLSFDDGRGWRVYLGVGADMEQKLVVYEAIVADLQARSLTPQYISVSNQEKPFYRAQ